MKALDRIRNMTLKRKINKTTSESKEIDLYDLFRLGGFQEESSETTYFTCLKMLSETLGKLPIKFYQETEQGTIKVADNTVSMLLKGRPNDYMTPTMFWTTVENNRNHYGNAYVWIRKELKRKKYGGDYSIKDLWIMPSSQVQIILDNQGVFGGKGSLFYWYQDKESGESYVFPSEDVMHFKTSMTYDGITGIPVRECLRSTIVGNWNSQEFMNRLYKNGLTAKAVLQYTGDLNEPSKKNLIESLEKYANGVNNAGKIIPIPHGMKLEPLNAKLTESQFFELKKYSALQIAGAFGVKPNQLNDYEKSSYSNSEMQNISFYIDTMLFILKQYEEEINYKLLEPCEREAGLYFRFNEKVLLRTDSQTQANILCQYVQNAIYTPNEARNYMNLVEQDGADELICNGNYIKIKQVGKAYE